MKAAAIDCKPNSPIPKETYAALNLESSLSVFIFDWDDTLFPTTALQALGPESLSDVLKEVDTIASELLAQVLETPRSQLVILTNAKISWVQYAAEAFMPKLNELLAAQQGRVLLISAHRERSEFAEGDVAGYTEAVRGAKREAVRPLADALWHAADASETFQVMSIGDQPHDLVAGHALREMMIASSRWNQPALVKTIAMKPMPSAQELAKELTLLRKSLPSILLVNRSTHQSMSPTRPPSSVPTPCRAGAVLPTATPLPVVGSVEACLTACNTQQVTSEAETVGTTPSTAVSSTSAGSEPAAPALEDASMAQPAEGQWQKRSSAFKRRHRQRMARERKACA